MNNKLFCMFAMAGILLATSCSNDELDTVRSGNEAQVTFSLGVEGGIGTKTRAISDGTGANKLIYAVFDENGNRISSFTKVEKPNVSFPTTETLTLAKGQTYKVAFWAQNANCSAYTLDDDMNVTVSYENATNNDETRDAFFKTETFTVTGSASLDVVLKRPFAQINVGVTTEDWEAAVASGITIDQSKVVVKNAATSLNLVTGAVSGSAEVTYDLAAIPAESLKVDTDKDGNISNSETYNWLSMSYILVNDGSVDGTQNTTLEGLEFTFKPESGNDITLKDGLTSVPVQRNWRTNILGRLLTGDITFNISIDPIYDDDYIYPDGSAQELAMAVANGGVVTLQEDVTLGETLTIMEGKTVTVNLNGHTINNTTDIWDEASAWSLFSVQGGTLLITGNGEVQAKENDCYAVDVQDGGKVIIESGTFVGNIHAVYVLEGSAEIKGGTFSVQQKYPNAEKADEFVINCFDDNYRNGTASVEITGGTFEKFNPADCAAEGVHTNFVAEGYSSVKVSDDPVSYQVVKNAENSTEAETAIGQNNGVAVISQNMTANSWSVGKNSTLVVSADATLSGDNSSPQSIMIGSGKSLTIEGEGTIEGPAYGTSNNSAAIWMARGTGKLTIDGNVTVKNKGGNTSDVDAPILIWGGGCTVTINNGYFYAYNDASGAPNPCVYLNGSRYQSGAYLNIYGGVFDSETETDNYLINVVDGTSSASHNKVQIYGGIFVGFNPANGDSGAGISTFVAEGYESVQTTYNGKTAWEVKKIGE